MKNILLKIFCYNKTMEHIFETVYPEYKEFIEKEKNLPNFLINVHKEVDLGYFNQIKFYIQMYDKNIFYSRMIKDMRRNKKNSDEYIVELEFNNKYYMIESDGLNYHKGDGSQKQIFFENSTRMRLGCGHDYRTYIKLEKKYIPILFSKILELMSENQNYDKKYTNKLINDNFFKKNHKEICYFFIKKNKRLYLDRIINVFKDFLLIHQYDNFKLQLIQKDIELEEKNKFEEIQKELNELKNQLKIKDEEISKIKDDLDDKNKLLKKILTKL